MSKQVDFREALTKPNISQQTGLGGVVGFVENTALLEAIVYLETMRRVYPNYVPSPLEVLGLLMLERLHEKRTMPR